MDRSLPRTAQTDESLLAAFAKGEDAALGELASRHERRLLGLALGLCGGNEALAREAVQETWLRVIRHAGGFRGQSSFATWVYRIAVNRCREAMERERRANRQREAGPPADPAPADESEWVRSAVDRLPHREREIVLLCHMRGMTHEQGAAVLGVPVGTLKSRLTRAMATLRGLWSREVSR